MEKENLINANIGGLTGRITRSRAAGVCASRQIPPIKVPMQVDQKLAPRVNLKRAALDEKNTCMGPQRKKRTVLRDVTNVGCGNLSKDLPNGTKVQPNNVKQKQTRKAPSNVSKKGSSAAVSTAQLQAGPKTEMIQERVMCGSIKLEERVPSQLGVTNDCRKDIGPLNKHTTGLPHSPPKKERKGGIFGDLIGPSNPDVTDIDSDQNNPLLCSLYASDIYNNLRVAELAHRPYCDFMEIVQRDITQGMRGILVDWLVEVSEEYKLVPDTLYLTVYLIDTFLARNYIERQRLQLLGITCMLIASKYEEICAPRVEEFCFITDNTYSREEVLKMESEVLKYLGFQVFTPTAKTFLRRFLRAAQASYKSPSLELEYLANYLAELTLMDYGFLNFVPSVIAASAVFLARWTLDQSSHPWNPTLEHYTFYKASDLQTSVHLLQDLQSNTSGCPLNAIRMKYRQDKFKSVAALSSSKLLESLF